MVAQKTKKKSFWIFISLEDELFERVNEFEYLGYVFNNRLSFIESQRHHETTCIRSLYAYQKQVIGLPPNVPFFVAEKSFDATVSSTVTFCSEIPGVNKNFEQLHYRFFKEFSNLQRSTSNNAFHYLTVRYLFRYAQIWQVLPFLKKAAVRGKDTLLQKALERVVLNARTSQRCWLKFVTKPAQEALQIDWTASLSVITDMLSVMHAPTLTDTFEASLKRVSRPAWLMALSAGGGCFFFFRCSHSPCVLLSLTSTSGVPRDRGTPFPHLFSSFAHWNRKMEQLPKR